MGLFTEEEGYGEKISDSWQMRKGLSVAKKKAGTFDRRGRNYYEKVEDFERQREGVLHCKKKKLVTTKRLGTFRQTRGRRFRFEKLGFLYFYFYDKESAKKVHSENGGAFSKRKF